jgi:hypothetical protein
VQECAPVFVGVGKLGSWEGVEFRGLGVLSIFSFIQGLPLPPEDKLGQALTAEGISHFFLDEKVAKKSRLHQIS